MKTLATISPSFSEPTQENGVKFPISWNKLELLESVVNQKGRSNRNCVSINHEDESKDTTRDTDLLPRRSLGRYRSRDQSLQA